MIYRDKIWVGRPLASGCEHRSQAGFAIGPILYILGLIGVGAGILFSSYSQILRSNQQVTNNLASKNDLQAIATTVAATSVLGSSDTTVLCPPTAGGASTNFANAPIKGAPLSGQPQLPANAASVGTTGNPTETGIFAAGSGLKQLDAWGHYYIYCRWENHTNPGSDPAFMVISAGPSGNLQTKCGDTTAKGDNLMVQWPVSTSIQRSSVWQTSTVTVGTEQISSTQFGETGHQLNVDALGDVTVPGTLTVMGGSGFSSTVTASSFIGPLTGNVNGNVAGDINGTGASSLGTLAVGASRQMTIDGSGNILTTGTLGATDTTITGTLTTSGLGTLDSLTVNNATNLSGTLGVTGASSIGNTLSVTGKITTATSAVNIGSTLAATGSSTPMLTVGKIVNRAAPFMVDQAGDVTASSFEGTLNGSVNGGTITGTWAGDFNGAANGVFSGSVTAASFNGALSGNATTATNVTGTVQIANGGTGATSASAALDNLFGADSSVSKYLNTNRIASGSISSNQMTATGASAGTTYYSVVVDSAGRVVSGSTTSSTSTGVSDASGDAVAVGTSAGGTITFSIGNVVKDVINSNGWLGVGTTSPTQMVEVDGGNILIDGSAASNRQLRYATDISGAPSLRWAAMTIGTSSESGNNGSNFVIQNYDNSGNAITTPPPLKLLRADGEAQFGATVTAPSFVATGSPGFSGDGSGLTNIPASAINGTIATSITLGTSASKTNPQRASEVNTGLFSDTSGAVAVASLGSEIMRVNGSGVGIGTSSLAGKLDVEGSGGVVLNAGNVAIGTTSASAALEVAGNIALNGNPRAIGFNDPANRLAIGDLGNGSNGAYMQMFGLNNGAGDTPGGGAEFVINSMNHQTAFNILDENGGWIPLLSVVSSGPPGGASVGVNTFSPASMLHVNGGEVQIGSSGLNCTNNNAGAIRYYSGTLYFCNGSTWTASNSGATATAAGSDEQVQFNHSGDFAADANFNWDYSNHRLGIGVSTPTYDLSFGGASAREIWLERAASGAGNNLTISAGGARAGETNTSGGSLVLSSGISTGTGRSNIQFQTYPAAASTNTSDNTPVTALKVFASGNPSSGQGTLATTLKATDGIGTDENGAILNLSSGTSTGTGTSSINFKVYGAGTTSATANSATTAMTILGNSSVGIGSTTPVTTLDVNGPIAISGVNGISYPTGDTDGFGASIAIGPGALAHEDTLTPGSFDNVAIGAHALGSSSLTTGAVQNTAVGFNALSSVTAGQLNTAVGAYAMSGGLVTGINNTAVGQSALYPNTIGNWNTAVGQGALSNNSTGVGNTGLGQAALNSLGSASNGGSGNTGVGWSSLANQSQTNDNTALGHHSGSTVTTGGGNIIIGAYTNSGSGITSGSNNILIGYDNTLPSMGNNQLNIGNLIFGTGLGISGAMATGSVGIHTAAPQSELHVYGGEVQVGSSGASCSSNNAGALRYSAGTLYYCNGDTTTWTASNSGATASVAGSDKQIQYNGGGSFSADANFNWDYTNHRLGIGVTAPTYDLSFGGATAREIWLERAPSGAGNNMTLSAGGAQSGVTDMAGGGLTLSSGISTGTGTSSMTFNVYGAATGSGSGDNSPTPAMTIFGGNNPTGDTTIAALTKDTSNQPGGSKVGGSLDFTELWHGTPATAARIVALYGWGWNGSLAFYTNSGGGGPSGAPVEAMRIDPNGLVGIGTTLPGAQLAVTAATSGTIGQIIQGAASQGADLTEWQDSTGGLLANMDAVGNFSAVTLAQTSDQRAKKNILVINTAKALDDLSRLRPVTFNWKATGQADMGLVAQEVEGVYPQLVRHTRDGKLALEYTALTGPIIASVQELATRSDKLATQITQEAEAIKLLKADNHNLRTALKSVNDNHSADQARLDQLEKEIAGMRRAATNGKK